MEHPKEADAYAVGGQVHTALQRAVAEVASMPEGEQRLWALRGIASLLVGTPEAFKAAAVHECPELESVAPIPDTHLTIEEQAIASRLTPADLQAIDAALIAGTVSTWRKVARVVGDALVTLQDRLSDVPLGIYIQRVEALARNGELEVQGNTQFMRFSEAKLPTRGTSAA